MSWKQLAALVLVALVVLVPSVQACNTGDGSVVGGTTFSIVQQPIVSAYTQAVVSPVCGQAVVYQQPLVQAVVGGYGSQAVVVRRSIFNDRAVVVHHHHHHH